MKKYYIIPAIETLEVRSTFAICEGSVGGENAQGNMSGTWPSPKRRSKPF